MNVSKRQLFQDLAPVDAFLGFKLTCADMRALPIFMLLLLPMASAQELASVVTTVTPSEYFLEIGVRPEEIPPATLRVIGEIQCQSGMDAPETLALTYAGETIQRTQGGQTETLVMVGLQDFEIAWIPQAGDRYTIDQTFDVPIIREAIPDHTLETSHFWDAGFAVPAGTTSCDPQGYEWHVDEQRMNLTVEGFNLQDDGFEFPERNDTPVPIGFALLALVALAFKKR